MEFGVPATHFHISIAPKLSDPNTLAEGSTAFAATLRRAPLSALRENGV